MSNKKNKNWIKGAIKRPGALTKKANNAGMSVPAFTNKVTSNPDKYDLRTVRQANLAKTLRKFQPGGDRALPTGAMTSTLSSPGLGAFQAQQQRAFEMQEYAKQLAEEQKAKEKAAEEAKKEQLQATAAQAGSKETFDLAQKGIEAFRAGRAAKKAGDVAKTATTAGKVANTGVYNPVGLGLNLAGSAVQAASDDNDPTKYNAGETTGTLMKGAGTGLGMAGTLTALAPALAIPGIGWAAAGVGALTAGAIALHRRNKARKEQAELDSKKAEDKNRLNTAFSDSWNQAFTKSGMDMGYNVGSSATNSYLPGQQQMMQTGGVNTRSLLSSLNQVDISKPIDPANLAMALEKRPSPSALSSYAYGAYSGPAIKSASNLSTNPYVLTGYQNALQQVRGYQTGGKVPGGEIKPLQGGAVEFVGRTHKEGGIMIDPSTEVEDGETMDKVNMVDKQGDYIFSNYLKLGGKTFAQRHKEILNRKGSQSEIQNLAKMQETVAAKDGEAGRTPKKIMQTAGERNPNESYFQNYNYAIQPRTTGKIPMEGDIDRSNWQATLNTPWAQNLGLDPNMTQEQLMQYYNEEYTPMVQNMAKENPDEFIARAKEFAFSNDPNAKYIRKQFNDDGSLKEGGLDKLVGLATDTQVGPYHAIFAPKKEVPKPETPPTPPQETPEPEKPQSKTPPEKEIPNMIPPKDLPMLPLGWAQLAGPAFALKNKYPEAQMAYTSPVGRINLPRVNYNAQRAANANATTAMQRSIENSSSGPAGMASRLAALNTAREADLEIANAESQVNKALMAEEASENLKADMANAQIGADMSQFNAQMRYQSDMNKYDTRHAAVSQIGNILTEIGKGYRQNLADERVARATQLNGEYDRERMKSAARLRNSTVNVGGKEVKFRNLSPQQQNEAAAAMYMGANDPTKVQSFLEEDKKMRAQAMAPKEEETTEAKKRGGRRYTSKFGKINKRTRKAK